MFPPVTSGQHCWLFLPCAVLSWCVKVLESHCLSHLVSIAYCCIQVTPQYDFRTSACHV